MYDLRRLYMNQNKKAILDLVFYLVIPFLIWKFAKPYIDPYYAMLLSSVPGIIYTLYTFKKEKQFNVTGFFILITLISNTTVDLFSSVFVSAWHCIKEKKQKNNINSKFNLLRTNLFIALSSLLPSFIKNRYVK